VRLGVKKWRNEEARGMFMEEITRILTNIGLEVPPEDAGRRVG
jgi:hypothetical protein